MATNLRCPECQQEFSTFDIGNTAECHRCGTKLTVRGKGTVAVADIALQLVLGLLVGGGVYSGHVVGYVFAAIVIVAWLVLMNTIMRSALTVHRADPPPPSL